MFAKPNSSSSVASTLAKLVVDLRLGNPYGCTPDSVLCSAHVDTRESQASFEVHPLLAQTGWLAVVDIPASEIHRAHHLTPLDGLWVAATTLPKPKALYDTNVELIIVWLASLFVILLHVKENIAMIHHVVSILNDVVSNTFDMWWAFLLKVEIAFLNSSSSKSNSKSKAGFRCPGGS